MRNQANALKTASFALSRFSARQTVQQQSQYILRQLLRRRGIERSQSRMVHQYVCLTDEQVDEFHRQIGGNQAAALQGVEEIAHEGVFFFVQFLEKSFQFQIGITSDTVTGLDIIS